jgi:hypothetical protein
MPPLNTPLIRTFCSNGCHRSKRNSSTIALLTGRQNEINCNLLHSAVEMCRAQYMLIEINVMQCHCSLMNVTLSKFQILFNNAILPLSAVSDHWLHFKIRRTAAATGHSGVHAKEMLKPAQ